MFIKTNSFLLHIVGRFGKDDLPSKTKEQKGEFVLVKAYVLDTNILMTTEGKAVYGFDDNTVVIPFVVLEELDKLKTSPGEKGFQARECIRTIDSLIPGKKSPLKDIPIPETKGTLRIYKGKSKIDNDISHLNINSPDNIIIQSAISISQEKPSIPVVLVTNDVAMRLKAISNGLVVQSYRNDQVDSDFSYTGRQELFIEDCDIDQLYKDKELPFEGKIKEPNKYIHLTNGYKTAECRYENGKLYVLPDMKQGIFGGITYKNLGQRFLLDALLAPADKYPLVVVKAPAGTGKTILSLAAGLEQTYCEQDRKRSNCPYNKIIYTRSNTLADEEFGFLPGDLQEKMDPLLAPMYDNLEVLLNPDGKESKSQIALQIKDMFEDGVVEICALSYIRGRSITNAYIILDEAQNLTRTQAKTIVTRVGEGSKLILLGDPGQIDNTKLDRRNNGLVYISEKFQNSPYCLQVELFESESKRSPLALEAIRLLD